MRAALLIALLFVQDPTKTEDLPVVRPLSGKVSVWRASPDKIEAVEKEIRVAAADRLGTLNGDVAKIATEGSLVVLMKGIKVAGGKGLSIERKGDKILLKVHKGSLAIEAYESTIEVDTPNGKAEGKEVYFLVTADENETKVVALDGKVTFSNDLGSVTLGEGQSSVGEKGKAPTKPRTASATEFEWVRPAEAESNLIKNAGFEDGLDGWNAEFPVIKEEHKIVHSGQKSCRFNVKVEGQSEPVMPTKTLKGVLKKDARYLLRYYLRTESFARDGKPAGLKIGIDRNGRGTWEDTTHHFVFAASEGEWAARRFPFVATGADVSIGLFTSTDRGRYTGTIFFDDFYLGEFPSIPSKGKR
jgi:hypothetical protein